MTERVISGLAVLAVLALGSCKDMGERIPPVPLALSRASFTLSPGGVAGGKLTGGTPPYEIADHGNEHIVTAEIAGDSLKLSAVGSGTTVVSVRDQGSPRYTIDVTVTVTSFGVDRNEFHFLTGDQDSAAIFGGIPPYVIVSIGDTSLVGVDLVGTQVRLRASRAGASTIVVGDAGVPQQRDTISVSVATAILFSSQVQPIFTASCVNAGCHPGGGAPFSLRSGSSYGNLVNVPATTGPCAGDKRVDPSSAATSALVKRIEGNCGAQMPLGGSPLSTAEIQLIRDWINQGARNN